MFQFAFKFVICTCFVVGLYADGNENRNKDPPESIAVIGGGLGGTSASLFLREKFGDDVRIDLFESATLCGRVATVTFGGREYESGASIVHSKNKYMRNFVDESPDLSYAESYNGGSNAFFNGKDYILRTSKWSIISFLQMLWTFGFDLFRLHSIEADFMDKFVTINDLQNQGRSFDDVTNMLNAMGGEEFVKALKVTSRELFSSQGLSKFTIDNLVSAGLRNNYGQNADANGFVGAVSMAGIQPGLWSVKGGNKRVCNVLLANSSANLIRERVTKVTFDAGKLKQKFTVYTAESSDLERPYDVVILATPVGEGKSNIDLSKACSDPNACPSSENVGEELPKEYRRTVANFIRGKLNSSLFHCNSMKDCPRGIFVTEDGLFFRSIGLHLPVDYNPEHDTLDQAVYKVFSTAPLTKDQISHLFETYTETTYVDWKAYPYYRLPYTILPMVLNEEGLYYTSPIEWTASAMEMSVISGKNSALLAFNNWYGLEDKMTRNSNVNSGYDVTDGDTRTEL